MKIHHVGGRGGEKNINAKGSGGSNKKEGGGETGHNKCGQKNNGVI